MLNLRLYKVLGCDGSYVIRVKLPQGKLYFLMYNGLIKCSISRDDFKKSEYEIVDIDPKLQLTKRVLNAMKGNL